MLVPALSLPNPCVKLRASFVCSCVALIHVVSFITESLSPMNVPASTGEKKYRLWKTERIEQNHLFCGVYAGGGDNIHQSLGATKT